MPLSLSREFTAAAACCIWPPSERRNLAIRNSLKEPIDWDLFLRIAKRQRVAGLIHEGLARADVAAPPHVASQIQDMAAGIARQNLLRAAESLRIQKSFDEAGVPLLFVKGVALAQIAYGTIALKHSWDIDLLVLPGDVAKALQLLAQAGYFPFPPLPPITDERYERWIRFGREYVLFHNTNSIYIELHWRLADNRYFLPGVTAASPSRTVCISGNDRIRTLADDDLFSYLCVHGALHGWSRLKWLADVAALMANDGAGDAERRLEAAKKVRAEDCVAQAFLLCDRLFATRGLATLAQNLRLDRRYRWLERTALGAMTSGGAETELGRAPFDLLSISTSHFMLGRGARFAAGELWNKLNGPYDLLYSVLPDRLSFLYPLVRLASWIKRRGRPRALPMPSKAEPECRSSAIRHPEGVTVDAGHERAPHP